MEMNNLYVLKYSLDSIAWFSGMLTRTDKFLLKSLVGEKINNNWNATASRDGGCYVVPKTDRLRIF